MQPTDALRSSGLALLRKPPEVLPAFMAQSAYQVVVQSVTLTGFAIAYLSLLGTGRIRRFFEAIREVNETMPEEGAGGPGAPGGGSAAYEQALLELVDATAALFTPTVLVLLGLTVVVGFLVGLVVRAVLAGAKVHTARAAMAGGSPLVAAIRGTRGDLVSYLGLSVVLFLVFSLPALLVVGAALTIALDATVGSLLTLIAATLATMVVLIGWPIAYVLLLFVPESIAVDGVGLIGALRRNVDFLTDHPLRAGAYALADLGSRLFLGIVAFLLGIVGMDQLAALALLIGLAPLLGLFKVGLYLDAEPPFADGDPYSLAEFREGLVGGARRAASELGRFVVYRVHLVGIAIMLFVVGGIAGWLAADSVGVTFPDREHDALFGAFGTIPVDNFFQIAANNWIVAMAHSFAGLGLGIPTVTNLLFNGGIVGLLVGFRDTPLVVFAALLAPHGIIEVPALSVSGAVGLALGWAALKYAVGDDGDEQLAAAIRRAFYVLVALLPAFVLASFVETFLTPQVAKVVRGIVGA